jgi:Transcription factor DP
MTKNLIERNRSKEELHDLTTAESAQQDLLYLPFILINAPRECKINCEMLEDRYVSIYVR